MRGNNMPEWLKDAVFYEIYPQSFYDSDGDGIGDLQGIIQKLDYVRSLGCNALWLNPVFDSPFLDGGYDVRDYRKIAERYGTDEDMKQLLERAHQMGMHVLLDLVPGHTSDQHPWFLESSKAEENEYSGRYIWTSHAFEGIAGHPYISGMKERAGAYMLNFFASQPALNYGWLNRTESWMSAVDSPEALATREAMKEVMRYWLEFGCDGFRVDMADSLVKNDDENKSATAAIWLDIRNMLDREYPEAALVSEWSNPVQAVNGGGFHMDFYLDHHHNGYNTLLRDYETEGGDHSFFLKEGRGDIMRFLNDWLPKYHAVRENGYISMFTCNHDTPRPARTLSEREMKLFYGFLLTMPGVPFLYYGDEIGMKYLDVRTKEGGYQRTGSRTPMQWDSSKNHGFSVSDNPYLPTDPAPSAPTVQNQLEKEDSLLHTVRDLIRIRHAYPQLQAEGPFEVLYAMPHQFPFMYARGDMIIAVNPSGDTAEVPLEYDAEAVYMIGECRIAGNRLRMPEQSFIILQNKAG